MLLGQLDPEGYCVSYDFCCNVNSFMNSWGYQFVLLFEYMIEILISLSCSSGLKSYWLWVYLLMFSSSLVYARGSESKPGSCSAFFVFAVMVLKWLWIKCSSHALIRQSPSPWATGDVELNSFDVSSGTNFTFKLLILRSLAVIGPLMHLCLVADSDSS